MPFDAEDMAVFFDADMPGYVEAVIDGTPVGALDRRKRYAESFGMVAGDSPALLVQDNIEVAIGASVAVGAIGYVVADVRPDGPGRQRLILESA